MLASVETQDLGESLSDVEASLDDLIPPPHFEEMTDKKERITYEIGRSRMT